MEQIDFSGYIQDRARDFTGREGVFREIDTWLSKEDGESVFLLSGEPGNGKTDIAIRLAKVKLKNFVACHSWIAH